MLLRSELGFWVLKNLRYYNMEFQRRYLQIYKPSKLKREKSLYNGGRAALFTSLAREATISLLNISILIQFKDVSYLLSNAHEMKDLSTIYKMLWQKRK